MALGEKIGKNLERKYNLLIRIIVYIFLFLLIVQFLKNLTISSCSIIFHFKFTSLGRDQSCFDRVVRFANTV